MMTKSNKIAITNPRKYWVEAVEMEMVRFFSHSIGMEIFHTKLYINLTWTPDLTKATKR